MNNMARTAWRIVRDAFHWWAGEMTMLLPSPLRKRLQQGTHHFILDCGQDGFTVTECRGSSVKARVQYELDEGEEVSASLPTLLLDDPDIQDARVVIRLASDQVLTKTLSLPVETEGNIPDVLGYEMDRQTPFSRDQVYYDYQVTGREGDGRQLGIRMVIVPRGVLDELLHKVRSWGLAPSSVTIRESESGDGQCDYSSINLLPPELRQAQNSAWNALNRALTLLLAGLAVAAVVVPFYLQQAAIEQIEARLANIRLEAESSLALQRELDRLVEAARLVVNTKRHEPATIDIINEVGKRLPDDTWLQQLQLKGTRLEIRGVTTDASALIGLLEDSPLFQNTEFHSPIVRDPRYGRFRFDIVADVAAGAGR